ncbi:MAG: LysM peptidoglycan-binding domain-containing protein [Candidatus Woykebacteria bacterium]
MQDLLKGRQSTIVAIVVVVLIIIAAFFLFGNRESGQVTDQAEKTQDEQKTQEEEKKAEEAKEAEQTKLPREYTVAKGDHLWKIASNVYNDGYKWVLIAQENELKNPDMITTGQKLTLPKPSTTVVAKSYTVVKGDTLWEISQKFYGSGSSWTKIRDANKDKVGKLKNGNPLIKPGQVLKIP